MKRFSIILALFLCACAPKHVAAQTVVAPATVSFVVMNAITTASSTPTGSGVTYCFSGLPAAGTSCGINNIAQNIHIATYSTSSPTQVSRVVFRIEASWDGINFIAISDDATGLASGEVVAIGAYPQIRLRLVEFIASGGATFSANYAGSSSTAGPLYGSYNPSQTIQKVVVSGASVGSSATFVLPTPTGSGLGYLFAVTQSGFFPANTLINVQNIVSGIALGTESPTINLSTTTVVPVPYIPASQIQINYTAGGAAANLFDLIYIFLPSGAISGISGPHVQPISAVAALTLNSETASATNTAITKSIGVVAGTRVMLFSVSARCSAGTASLTVKDGVGGTVIWSTAATEVSTTTFKFQWNPGLASSFSSGMDIVLSTCGAGNTGTLDVQISQQ